MDPIFVNGVWRMDWGLGNPNKTASLIAILMIFVWLPAYFRKWAFWISLVAFCALGICLIHSMSRGGLVALFLGLLPLLAWAPRPWPTQRIVAILISFMIMLAVSIYLQAHERFGQGIVQEDRSVSNRLEVWKAAPAMMVDAPGGWGIGNSGKAYMDWYQALDRNESYRTLVNSHLTWLVEFNWFARFLYIAAWLAIFAICLPSRRAPWLAVPFGIWLAFFVGALFSSVAESLWLWIVPCLALVFVLAWRFRSKEFPGKIALATPLVSALVICLALAALTPRSPFHKTNNTIFVGKTPPVYWIAADKKVLGQSFARTLRAAMTQMPSISCALIEKTTDLPPTGISKLILTGALCEIGFTQDQWKSLQSLILVNPTTSPISLVIPSGTPLRVLVGDFAQSSSAADWASVRPVETIPGIGDFVPNWPMVLFNPKKPEAL